MLPLKEEPGTCKEIGRVLVTLGRERGVVKIEFRLICSTKHRVFFLSHCLSENSVVPSERTIFR